MLSIGGIGAGVQAQKIDSIDPLIAQQVVISANRDEDIAKNVAQNIKTIRAKEFKDRKVILQLTFILSGEYSSNAVNYAGKSCPEGLWRRAGSCLSSMVWMNNLIYHAGHLQDIVKTDPNSLGSCRNNVWTVSTIYGSDALGGVIHNANQRSEIVIWR